MPPYNRIDHPIGALDPPWPIERRGAPRWFYIPVDQWVVILVLAGIVAVCAIPAYESDSMWIGVGLFAAVVAVLHTLFAARMVPWIPGLIALMALLQWVIAPWAGYHTTPELPVFAMSVPPDEYFSYAVPAAALLLLGLYTPLWRISQQPLPRRSVSTPAGFSRTCDAMIVFGFAANLLINHSPDSLRYLMTLLSYLSFVGAFGHLLVRTPGWWWRVLAVLAVRAAMSTENGLFHDLLLWAAYTGALAVFVARPRVTTILAIVAASAFLIGVLNEAKYSYRRALQLNPGMPLVDRVAALTGTFENQASLPQETFTGDALTRIVTRLNQGWIIARILVWVPTSEPFARGETVMTAFRAALVPRLLDPGKYEAGGAINFPRFTGLTIAGGTSMNLSPAGEMYANFGRNGGLFAMYLFGVGLGLVYLWFANAAQSSPLWWAWAPYVMLYTMQAENGIGEGVNHVAKSFLVMMAVVTYVPAWRTLRRWHLRRATRPVRA
jgi:hypothetical protein